MPAAAQAGTSFHSAKQLLKQFAVVALEGRGLDAMPTQTEAPTVPLPLHARAFLKALGALPDVDALVSEVHSLLLKAAFVSRAMRLRLMIGSCLLPVVMMVAGLFTRPQQMAFGEFFELVALAAGVFWFLFVIVPSLIGAFLFKGGALLHRLEIAVVTADGSPASRWRIFCRTMLAWSPILLTAVLLPWLRPRHHLFWVAPVLGILWAVFVMGAIWSLRRPERGPQDRIAGTWLVPQ